MNLRMTPIDFNQAGEPRDPLLYAAVQEFAEKEFGEKLNVAYYARLFVALAVIEDKWKVVGVTGIRSSFDIPTFHIAPQSLDKEGFKVAEEVTNMMYMRLNNYLADLGNKGGSTLIYVAPEKERFWRRFLKRVGGKPANRYEVEVR